MDFPRSFSHYDVTSSLGRGGMGEVMRAHDTRLGRDVALKMLPPEFAADPERQARFEREARLLAQLQHANIASVYGYEHDGDRHFLVMELVEGEDLARRIARGALPVDEAVDIAAQVAAGLEEAHERGIVHRDLKPANVMLTPDGRVKILDFGLARAFQGDIAGEDDLSNSPTITAAMTGAGTILGTAAYMSPEQARGKSVDRRADIWALGVILHEMLTGQRLFGGETLSDTLAAVLRKDVDLDDLPADTPPAVRRLLARCLDRDPKQRLRDAGEARIVLRDPDVLEARPAAMSAAPGPARTVLGVALVVVAAVVAAGAAWLVKPVPEAPLRKLELGVESEVELSEFETALAISPDGGRVVFAAPDAILIREFERDQAVRVEQSEETKVVCWSPDGEWVAFWRGGEIWKVPAVGGRPQRVADLGDAAGGAAGMAWLPDGRIYLTPGDKGILAVPAAGGRPEEAVGVNREVEQDLHHVVAMPGGGLLYVEHRLDGINALGVMRDGVRKSVLHLPGEYLQHPAWSPTGHLVYTQGEGRTGLWAVAFDLDRLEVTGEPFFLAAQANVASIGADGTMVYLKSSGDQRIQEMALLDRAGRDLHIFGSRHQIWPFPALGRNADLAVAVSRDLGVGIWDLWLHDERGGTVRLTDDPAEEDCPILTPDGRHVIYGTGNAGSWQLVRRAVDGTGAAEVLVAADSALPPDYYGAAPSISDDGRLLLYGATGIEGSQDVALLRLDEDGQVAGDPEPVVATRAIEMGGAVSPDGGFLAYMSNATGRLEVYVARFPSGAGRRQVSMNGGLWPHWRADGGELYFVDGDSLLAVEIELGDRMLIGTPRGLFAQPRTQMSMFTGLTEGFAVTPDGQMFLVPRFEIRDQDVLRTARIAVVENWIREYR